MRDRVEVALKVMGVPPRYQDYKTTNEEDKKVTEAFELIENKFGIVLFSVSADRKPTEFAVKLLKRGFDNGKFGFFQDIFGMLNEAKLTGFEETVTVWEHCKEVEVLVIDNVVEDIKFYEKEQRMLIELLIHRFNWNRSTVIVVYSSKQPDKKWLVDKFGKSLADFIVGNFKFVRA